MVNASKAIVWLESSKNAVKFIPSNFKCVFYGIRSYINSAAFDY